VLVLLARTAAAEPAIGADALTYEARIAGGVGLAVTFALPRR